MARSSLFRALRRLARRAAPPSPTGWSRRDFLGAAAAASTLPLVGCGDNIGPAAPRSIAIVGGGIAGLTAAHYLARSGVRADVYEGAMRVGGRSGPRGASGRPAGGISAELVDTDHV